MVEGVYAIDNEAEENCRRRINDSEIWRMINTTGKNPPYLLLLESLTDQGECGCNGLSYLRY